MTISSQKITKTSQNESVALLPVSLTNGLLSESMYSKLAIDTGLQCVLSSPSCCHRNRFYNTHNQDTNRCPTKFSLVVHFVVWGIKGKKVQCLHHQWPWGPNVLYYLSSLCSLFPASRTRTLVLSGFRKIYAPIIPKAYNSYPCYTTHILVFALHFLSFST